MLTFQQGNHREVALALEDVPAIRLREHIQRSVATGSSAPTPRARPPRAEDAPHSVARIIKAGKTKTKPIRNLHGKIADTI